MLISQWSQHATHQLVLEPVQVNVLKEMPQIVVIHHPHVEYSDSGHDNPLQQNSVCGAKCKQ